MIIFPSSVNLVIFTVTSSRRMSESDQFHAPLPNPFKKILQKDVTSICKLDRKQSSLLITSRVCYIFLGLKLEVWKFRKTDYLKDNLQASE